MRVTWDAPKRESTLRSRGLDFADAAEVLAGPAYTFEDRRRDYGEMRKVTVGLLRGRMVLIVHIRRGETTHVISMRKANGREQKIFRETLDQP